MTRANLRIFYFLFKKRKYCHVAGHNCVTCQTNIGCFNLVSLFENLIQFSPPIFKMIQFCPLQCEIKLIIKLNYNLYIHVKIIFYHLYIKLLPIYSCYFISYIFFTCNFSHLKFCTHVKKRKYNLNS